MTHAWCYRYRVLDARTNGGAQFHTEGYKAVVNSHKARSIYVNDVYGWHEIEIEQEALQAIIAMLNSN